MPIALSVDLRGRGDRRVKDARRLLLRVRRRGVSFATKATLDSLARLLREALHRQYKRDMKGRRKTFPRAVLRARRSLVNRDGVVVRPARVVNIAANEVLRRNIRGGLRRARGGRLFIPASWKPRRTSRKRAGEYEDKGKIWQSRRRGPDKFVATLARQARYKPRWRIRAAVRRVSRLAPRVAARELERELRRALMREGV